MKERVPEAGQSRAFSGSVIPPHPEVSPPTWNPGLGFRLDKWWRVPTSVGAGSVPRSKHRVLWAELETFRKRLRRSRGNRGWVLGKLEVNFLSVSRFYICESTY